MATADSGVKPLQYAMKMAKSAIQLDAGNKHQEAYCEYLRIIHFLSYALLEEATSEKADDQKQEVERMLRLAEQCLERAKSFIEKSTEPPAQTPTPCASSVGQSESTQPSITPVTSAANTVSPSNTSVDKRPKSSSPTKSHRRVLSDGGGLPSPFMPPEVFQKLQTMELEDSSKKELTPIEEASRLNQKLKANYEARLARLPPGQAYQKTSLTLSLQRQMMENLIIARARQDALQRKMEERRLRLQEEANRRFAASGAMTAEEQEQRILYTNVLEYEQDHDWPKLWKAKIKMNPDNINLVSELVSYLLSQADHPVLKLLRKYQYRIYNRVYPIVSKGVLQSPGVELRASLSSQNLLQPDTPKKPERRLSSSICSHSFSTEPSLSPSHCQDHHIPSDHVEGETTVDRENSFEDLEQFLSQLDWVPPQDSTDDYSLNPELQSVQLDPSDVHVQEMEMRAIKDHLKAIVKDIHIAIEQLLSLCLLSFECLNTATSKDLCLACIEEAFFTPLWSALMALFRRVHRERELAFEASVRLYGDASPGDVGVPLKLFPPNGSTLQGSYPYESAVQELRLLIKDFCPQRKLDCIVRTLRLICACAEDYRCLHETDSTPKTAAIGADDLLPILSYVALRSQCPQLVSECAALEEFIHEGYLIGEEGYCLTSMQSALSYVESLHARKSHSPLKQDLLRLGD
ncbi:VPS9 domain-containing protein 1 isoform X1 [Boleophthalmus pectinirostris]|uniref:VPS9 domain-containing protein 1 isoform X1 n=2 Tax=Boleophthalmus pectinirostris TaxID=150288 RepID=UPI00242F2F98|nr:VPS9 domain-containing protein 1 isoform X1 [Boleophthalmus pectinirostris]